jgi:hypothetical protein
MQTSFAQTQSALPSGLPARFKFWLPQMSMAGSPGNEGFTWAPNEARHRSKNVERAGAPLYLQRHNNLPEVSLAAAQQSV